MVPWERRPLAMKIYERTLGQPIEEIIALAWYQHRKLGPIGKLLSLEDTTLRRWMRNLGLLICADCSKKSGVLFTETYTCPGCKRYFCDECIENQPIEHFI